MTVDLDVLVRSRLLDWLAEETTTRGATVLYATHIFDGLDQWPTHLCHLQLGSTLPPSPMPWPLPASLAADLLPEEVLTRMDDPNRRGSRLLEVALHWLVVDRRERVDREIAESGREKRGAQEANISSEAFYRKCVTSRALSCYSLASLLLRGGRPRARSHVSLAWTAALMLSASPSLARSQVRLLALDARVAKRGRYGQTAMVDPGLPSRGGERA